MAPSRALVIGSSVAGLSAARVLADRFDEVIVVERDAKPEVAEPRKGVPQGRHVHALLKAGEHALEGLFPGLIAELEKRGGHVFDFANDIRWHHHGVWKKRYLCGLRVHCQSRPLVELAMRERVAANPKIQFRYQTSVEELEIKDGRVSSALLKDATRARGEKIDLAVDTSGRGSQIDRTLVAAGFKAPFEERVGIDLQYTSQMIELAPRARDFRAVLVYPKPPEDKRGGLIFPIEGGRHMVTLVGWQGDHPPADLGGFTAFARSLAQPDIARELVDCKRIGEAAVYKFPYARRKRFDRMDRAPQGLFVLGDAFCSFDPVFGQGMSTAAMGAALLQKHLAKDPRGERPLRYFKALQKILRSPWMLCTSEDFRYPQTTGARPPGITALQRYTSEVFALTAESPAVYGRFAQVMNLLSGPELLFHPAVLARVLPRLIGLRKASPPLLEPA